MKVSKLFNSLPKRLFAAALVALATLLPVSTLAAAVNIEGAMGVANVTAGDTKYSPAVNASYNQVVKFQVYYHNTELPDSGKIAQNLRVKIDIPTAAGTSQTQTATISGDNTNTVTSQTKVNLDRADAYLQYLPGSAVWRHNTGTNEAPVWTDTVISDAVVNSGTGLVLENEKPCYNYSATVTVMARVMVPGVSVDKQVRLKGTTAWATSITAQPGQDVEYMISYKNTGNATQENVVVGDKLPEGVTYVPGTTKLANSSFPSGTAMPDGITTVGLVIGTYPAGINAFVKFEAKLPAEDKLACGANQLRNVATVQPKGMNYYYNTADVVINKTCAPTPVYSCDDLTVVTGDNRTVTATVKYTAKDGATFKNATFTWGDNASNTVATATTTHQYANYGTYTITVKPTFSVNGVDKTAADNSACSKNVTFTPPTTPKTPGVKIEKSVAKSQVAVGENYNYTLKVTNTGEVDLANVKVTDTPKDGSNIQLVDANGVGTITDNTWNYTIATLKVGESKSFTLTAKVTKYTEGSLVNTACVNAPEVNPSEPNKQDDCDDATVTVPKPEVPKPVYQCDDLTLTIGDNRTVTATVKYTAKDGAALKTVTYNWGDNTTPFMTDKTSASHTYTTDGSFTVSVRLLFGLGDATSAYAADNVNCVKKVTFTPNQPPVVTPNTPATPAVLPNTGAGSVASIFTIVAIVGTVAHRLFLSRKLAK